MPDPNRQEGWRDLAEIQRWMQAVITHPGGVEEGIGSSAARQQIDIGPEQADRVVTRSRSLSGVDRLAIYANAYYARLLECLRDEFPVLKHALGEETFDAFAVEYLQKYPSRSYTLVELGANFPRFLEETRPHDDEAAGGRPSWPDFLIDLAMLELTFSRVFDGPGVEGKQLLNGDQIASLDPERLLEARLICVPCLRLLALRYPVHDYVRSVRRKEDVAPPEPAATFLAIGRRDYVVHYYDLTEVSYRLLLALQNGEPIGTAIHQVATTAGTDIDQTAINLRQWFQEWAAEGFFEGIA